MSIEIWVDKRLSIPIILEMMGQVILSGGCDNERIDFDVLLELSRITANFGNTIKKEDE